MSLFKMLFALTVLIFSLHVSFGQDFIETEDWLSDVSGYKRPWIYLRYKHYTEEDVVRAKEKLALIRRSPSSDEWSGTYDFAAELHDVKLIWADAGFIDFDLYTCALELRRLNYGSVINSPDSVIFVTERSRPANGSTASKEPLKFVKVKWGDRHYLVEEDKLELFCELAAGYHSLGKMIEGKLPDGTSYEYQILIWNSFWVMAGKEENKVYGTPILPKIYSKFVKPQLEARIIRLGKHEIEPATEERSWAMSKQFVTIGLGSAGGVRADMDFYVPQLDERIRVVKVFSRTALAVLERSIDSETQKEDCLKPPEGEKPCKRIKAGMKIKTVPEEFLEEMHYKKWEQAQGQ